MDSDFEIYCPSYESAEAFLQVTRGCSHGSCVFCSMFKEPFRVLSYDELKCEVSALAQQGVEPTRVFLQAGDAFSANFDTLMYLAELLRRYVPSVSSIGAVARVNSIATKSVRQLRDLHEAGYDNLYLSWESGCDEILTVMNKGFTAAQAREQLLKLQEADMPYVANYLCGAGGAGRGSCNARETAALYEGLHPTMIDMTMLTVLPGTILWDMVQQGSFSEASEVEKLEEAIELLETLACETLFTSGHGSNTIHISYQLPNERQQAISQLNNLLEALSEPELQRFRRDAADAF